MSLKLAWAGETGTGTETDEPGLKKENDPDLLEKPTNVQPSEVLQGFVLKYSTYIHELFLQVGN